MTIAIHTNSISWQFSRYYVIVKSNKIISFHCCNKGQKLFFHFCFWQFIFDINHKQKLIVYKTLLVKSRPLQSKMKVKFAGSLCTFCTKSEKSVKMTLFITFTKTNLQEATENYYLSLFRQINIHANHFDRKKSLKRVE